MPYSTSPAFDQFAAELQKIAPFRIHYKDESPEMSALNLVVSLFCPDFMSRFTTVIGRRVYFPSRDFVAQRPQASIRILAHEAVHLLDSQRWGFGTLALAYLFPQILALGVFLYPWLGLWAFSFLIFLAPWPAPFRFYFEARAYALDCLTAYPEHREAAIFRVSTHFDSWDYYRMFPFPQAVQEELRHWMDRTESGQEKDLMKILLIYEMSMES